MVIPSEFSMGQYTDDHLRENALQFNISFRLLIFFFNQEGRHNNSKVNNSKAPTL